MKIVYRHGSKCLSWYDGQDRREWEGGYLSQSHTLKPEIYFIITKDSKLNKTIILKNILRLLQQDLENDRLDAILKSV